MDTFIARKTVFDNFSLPLVYLSNPYLLISYLLEYFTYTKRHTSISLAVEKKYVKVCLILCADDIVVFANSSSELQKSLDLLFDYCQRLKLVIDTSKTKLGFFRKGGRLPQSLNLYYNNNLIETMYNFSYLGIVLQLAVLFQRHRIHYQVKKKGMNTYINLQICQEKINLICSINKCYPF